MNFTLQLFQIPTSLQATFDLNLAFEVHIVDTTLMLKAVKNYHCNKTNEKTTATSG
jgi:hypothetical protein